MFFCKSCAQYDHSARDHVRNPTVMTMLNNVGCGNFRVVNTPHFQPSVHPFIGFATFVDLATGSERSSLCITQTRKTSQMCSPMLEQVCVKGAWCTRFCTKPHDRNFSYQFIGFGAMDCNCNCSYEFIRFGAMDCNFP